VTAVASRQSGYRAWLFRQLDLELLRNRRGQQLLPVNTHRILPEQC
jgi:hypothetical protein